MTIQNYQDITLRQYLLFLKSLDKKEYISPLLKEMSRVAFDHLWNKLNGDDLTYNKTLHTVGQIGFDYVEVSSRNRVLYKQFCSKIKDREITGLIRDKTNKHDNMRWILTSDGDDVFLFLDLIALDLKLKQCLIYNRKISSFEQDSSKYLIESLVKYGFETQLK